MTTLSLMQASNSAPQLLGEGEGAKKTTKNGGTNGYLSNSNGYYPDSDEEDPTRGSTIPKLKVFDLRSYTAALGNRAKGGGCECTGGL